MAEPKATQEQQGGGAGETGEVVSSLPLLVGEQVLYRMGGGPAAGFYRPAIVVKCIGEATCDLAVFTGGEPENPELLLREPVQMRRTITEGGDPGQFIRQAMIVQVG